MVVLSVDPGHTTGMVLAEVLGTEVHVLGAGSFALHQASELEVTSMVERLVIEEPPQIRSSKNTRTVYDRLLYQADFRGIPVTKVRPVDWKQTKRKFVHTEAYRVLRNQHERDALTMLLAVIAKEKGNAHVR